MDRKLDINSGFYPAVSLRSIQQADQANLRNWKNKNRNGFFYKEIITEEEQLKWYHGYLSRLNDYMFIVQVGSVDIGCMGFRLMNEGWDIYNVILGNPDFGKKGNMAHAFTIMCSFAQSLNLINISAKVVKENPALDWYCRNGFRVAATFNDYIEIEINPDRFYPCAVTVFSDNNQ